MCALTALVVEDNMYNSKLVCALLTFRGINVLSVETAELAIQIADDHQPDIILLDIELGEGDGRAVLTELRARANTAHIPLVAVTASAMHGDRERFLAHGFDGYLPKPIDVDSFVDSVLRIVRRAS